MAELTHDRGGPRGRVAVLKPQVFAWVQDYGVYAAVLALLLFNVLFTPTSSTPPTSAPSSSR